MTLTHNLPAPYDGGTVTLKREYGKYILTEHIPANNSEQEVNNMFTYTSKAEAEDHYRYLTKK